MTDLKIIWSCIKFPTALALTFCAMFTVSVYAINGAVALQEVINSK